MPSSETETRRLSLIVPAFQEALLLGRSIAAIAESARQTGFPFELVIVDDGSTDDTWKVIQNLLPAHPEINAVRLSRNFGKEGAIAAGLDVASGDACILLDADLQHPPALIAEMVRLWSGGEWDVVEAVKAHRGSESLAHKLTARAFYRVSHWLTGYDLQDASDFKLLDRKVVEAWRQVDERATFFRGLVAWMGFRRTTVHFEVPPRPAGLSRWSMRGLVALAVHAVTAFSAVPLQIVTLLGVVMLLLAVGVGFQATRLWFLGQALPGFTTVILLQLITGGFLMVSLGVIGIYLARIYEEVKGRPRYIVRERTGRQQ